MMDVVRKGNEGVFRPKSVEVQEVTIGHMVKAEQMAGNTSGMKFIACLASLACTFDGEKVPPEDIERMAVGDFLQLAVAFGFSEQAMAATGKS